MRFCAKVEEDPSCWRYTPSVFFASFRSLFCGTGHHAGNRPIPEGVPHRVVDYAKKRSPLLVRVQKAHNLEGGIGFATYRKNSNRR